jgi:hypothetical protein
MAQDDADAAARQRQDEADAVLKTEREARQKLEREQADRAAAAKQKADAEAAAARKAAAAPDAEKIRSIAVALMAIPLPQMSTPERGALAIAISKEIASLANWIDEQAAALAGGG